MHWGGKCPHQNESVNMFKAEDSKSENNDSEEINIVLTNRNFKNDTFVQEALKLTMINNVCTKTVAGEVVQRLNVKDFSIKYKNELQTSTSNTAFKFGDDHKVYSLKKVRIPANMGRTESFIDAEIGKEKIALLLS